MCIHTLRAHYRRNEETIRGSHDDSGDGDTATEPLGAYCTEPTTAVWRPAAFLPVHSPSPSLFPACLQLPPLSPLLHRNAPSRFNSLYAAQRRSLALSLSFTHTYQLPSRSVVFLYPSLFEKKKSQPFPLSY